MLPVLVAPLPWGVGSALHRGFAASFPEGTEVARVQAIGSLEDRVASVELARRARGWERCIVAGHSMATLVALRAALDFPLQVAGLVLVGGAAGPAALREGLWRPGHPKHADWLAAYQRLRASGQMRPYVEALVRLSITTPGAWEALAPDLAAAPMNRERMGAFFQEELPRNDLAPRLGEVACPTLVVAGQDDALCTPRAAKEMAKGLLRARLDVLPGGHWPWVEAPAEFRASLASWLATLDGEPGERAWLDAPPNPTGRRMGAVGSVLRRVAAAGEQRERSYQVVSLEAAQGLVQARYWPAPAAPLPSAGTGRSARAGVVWLGGAGGGWDSPARGLYPALAEALQREGIASVRVRYRRRGDLAACAQDAVEGVRFLRQQGCPAVALVGHSFGGAVAVQAAAREPRVRSVVTLATQGLGTDPVVRLGPDCALLAVHGTADTRLPPACSARLWEDAHDPKRLVLFDGAGHGLDEVAPEVRALLGAWLREWLAGPP